MEVTFNPVKSSLACPAYSLLTEYRGALVRARFAGAEAEFRAAISGCVVLDQSWSARLRVGGGDAQRWLNGMVTNTAALPEGSGNYSFLLSAQGRLQGDVYAFRQGSDYVLETSADQQEKVMQWLDRYIIMDDVVLAPDDSFTATIALTGPQAEEILTRLGADVATLPALTVIPASFAGTPVKIVRDDVNSLPLFRIWHEPDRSQQLWETLVHAGATEAGCEAEELLRIASGTPQFGVDLLERDLPQETGQQRALHFSKGCYIGQEIVERIHSRGNVHRGWRGFVADSPLSVGAKAESEGKEIGTLTSVATLPFESGNVHVGLGIVRLQAVEQGKPLLAAGASVEPATLPFLKI